MEELEREQIVVDLSDRRGRGVTEARIGGRGHRLEFGGPKSSPTKGVMTRTAASA